MNKNRFCKAILMLIVLMAFLTFACQNKEDDNCKDCWDKYQVYEFSYGDRVLTYNTMRCRAVVQLNYVTDYPLREVEYLLRLTGAKSIRYSLGGNYAIFDGFGKTEYNLIIGSEFVEYIHPYFLSSDGYDDPCEPFLLSRFLVCWFIPGTYRFTVDSFATAHGLEIETQRPDGAYYLEVKNKHTHSLRLVMELQHNELIECIGPVWNSSIPRNK